jgi:hypothetical protein
MIYKSNLLSVGSKEKMKRGWLVAVGLDDLFSVGAKGSFVLYLFTTKY